MAEQVRCPECNQQMTKPGLHGHLRFKHFLAGEELNDAYEEATGERPGGSTNSREPERARAPERTTDDAQTRGREQHRKNAERHRAEEPTAVREVDETEAGRDRRQRSEEVPTAEELRKELGKESGEQRRGADRERPRESRRPEHNRKARAVKRALRALDRLREAKHRRKVAEEETDAPQSTMNRILYGSPKGDDVGICEACETEVEQAREEYREAVTRLREVQEEEESK